MVALSWKWFLRLAQRGKDPTQFPSAIASYAARAVRSGRGVCGQENGKDVLSPLAQRRHRFTVGKLPDHETLSDNPLCDALARQHPVAAARAPRFAAISRTGWACRRNATAGWRST